MTESEFNDLVDSTLETLEFALDELDDDVEYEVAGGVLTLEFDNGSTMVFSRQPPVQQLWLAARSGGFHFSWDEQAGDWCDTREGRPFRPFVVEAMREQAGIEFNWG
ncbi:MAG: iron donor protein CyaY [Halioglobus sp.]